MTQPKFKFLGGKLYSLNIGSDVPVGSGGFKFTIPGTKLSNPKFTANIIVNDTDNKKDVVAGFAFGFNNILAFAFMHPGLTGWEGSEVGTFEMEVEDWAEFLNNGVQWLGQSEISSFGKDCDKILWKPGYVKGLPPGHVGGG